MELGLHISNFTMPGGPAELGKHLREIARAAEDAGFTTISVMDHFFQIQPQGPPEMEMLEGYTALSYMAAVTSRVRFNTLVTGVTYRHPGILVKQVTALDVLSGGRAILGIGAAWNELEHKSLGVPFPSWSERYERLEEALQIALQMWSGEEKPFHGKHYSLERTLNSPQALSKPHPPILIGGSGEKKTLKLVAKYADACNLFASQGLDHKLDVLRQHCADVGRDYNAIRKTTANGFNVATDGREGSITPKQMIEALEAQAELGIQEARFSIRNTWELDRIALIGREVLPKITSL